ncbi:MAG TPA: type II toxin-antitoxin system RelE/ParE family toxin [Dongiaceae bacterium]|nr:type II toxin-antitoxin system RelE/ParE family toxin [Dongiaceae bacterium]
MANYRLTRKADNDVANLYEYGILNFGLNQAQSYLLGLYEQFEQLSFSPDIGRNAKELFPDLKRFQYGAHVIFYLPDNQSGILIVRILRKEMDFIQHL